MDIFSEKEKKNKYIEKLSAKKKENIDEVSKYSNITTIPNKNLQINTYKPSDNNSNNGQNESIFLSERKENSRMGSLMDQSKKTLED